MVTLALLSLTLLQWLPRGGEKPQPESSQTRESDTRAAFTTPLFGLIAIVFWFVGLSGIWAFVERVGLLVGLSQTTVGSLLALVYVWKLVESAYFGQAPADAPSVREAPWSMLLPIWVLVGANVYFGIHTEVSVGVARQAATQLMGGGG